MFPNRAEATSLLACLFHESLDSFCGRDETRGNEQSDLADDGKANSSVRVYCARTKRELVQVEVERKMRTNLNGNDREIPSFVAINL